MSDAPNLTPADWSWLAGTYWCVPAASLPALQLDTDTNELAWMADQTVWHLAGYGDGYLWGVSATLLWPAGEEAPTSGPRSKPGARTLMGSITPEGRAHFTFVAQRGSSAPVTGVGRAVPHAGGWSLEMQMSTGTSSVTAHWAYMVRVQPGDPMWDSLPGARISVPEFLEGCETPIAPPAPTPDRGGRSGA